MGMYDTDDTLLDEPAIDDTSMDEPLEEPSHSLDSKFYHHLSQILGELHAGLEAYHAHAGSHTLQIQIKHLLETMQHLEHFTVNPQVGPQHEPALKMTARIVLHYVAMCRDHGFDALGSDAVELLREIESVAQDIIEGI